MFGVIVAQLDCLDETEKARYQEVYCGLCHSLKERYGQLSRLCVNYDMAFLALLLESLNERGEERAEGSCILQLGKRHTYARGPYVDYAADLSVVLAYYKCLDDWQDESNAAGLVYAKALADAYRRIEDAYPQTCALTKEKLSLLTDKERESQGRVDEVPNREERYLLAEAIACDFGDIMSQMFAHGAGYWEDDLRAFGYHMGRFVYFMDAAIDRDKDAMQGNYNPFVTCAMDDVSIDFILHDAIGCAARVFERLPLEKDLHLLRSVIYAGVWTKLLAQRAEEEATQQPEQEQETNEEEEQGQA